MNIGIVGAGIFGLTTAAELVSRGHFVTVFDQGDIPNSMSSSYDYHRLIRHPYGPKTGYASLVPHAFGAWNRLWNRLEASFYTQTGCLAVSRLENDWISNSAMSLTQLGIPFELLKPSAIASRFPWLQVGRYEVGLFTTEGGILESGQILNGLVSYLSAMGAVLYPNTRVQSFNLDTASIQTKSEVDHTFDALLLALGAWHASHFPSEITAYKQNIAFPSELPLHLTIEGNCPMILDLADDGGFYYIPGNERFPGKYGDHVIRTRGDVDTDRTPSSKERDFLTSMMKARIPEGITTPDNSWEVCYYSCTIDRDPEIRQKGKSIRFFGGSGHSFKWGALFGELMADVVLGKRSFSAVDLVVSGQATP